MKTLVAMLILMMTLSSKADDMHKYLSDTQEMVRLGQYKEALDRYIWFHEHVLEHDPAMYGVRLSFALSYWKTLGDIYQPARTALVETRDRKTKQLTDKGGNAALFHDVAALNRTLQEDNKTVELFQLLDQTHPDLAQQSWNMVKDAVISAKRYDLVRKYIGSPMLEFTRIKAMYDLNTTLYDNTNIGSAQFKAYNENHFVEESLRLIEVALALDDQKVAKDIQEKALVIVDDYRLRDAVK